MKLSALLLLLLPVAPSAQSQHFSYARIDFKEIRAAVERKRSPFYFPALYERYRTSDTTLTREEFRHLYYGYTFREDYRPYAIHDAEEMTAGLMNKDTLTAEDFSEVFNRCREILESHPFSLRYLATAAIASAQTGSMAEATRYYYKYQGVLSAILSSGDGASEQSAWSVILVSDEYELLRSLGFTPSGVQKLLPDSRCDFIGVSDNEYGIEGFYFDISRPFAQGFD